VDCADKLTFWEITLHEKFERVGVNYGIQLASFNCTGNVNRVLRKEMTDGPTFYCHSRSVSFSHASQISTFTSYFQFKSRIQGYNLETISSIVERAFPITSANVTDFSLVALQNMALEIKTC